VPKPFEIAVTGTNSITPLGNDAAMTATAVLNGESRIEYSDTFYDEEANPIKTAVIERGVDSVPDEAAYMAKIAEKCLAELCDRYFANRPVPGSLHFFLGLPSKKRPGPRFEGNENQWTEKLTAILAPFAHSVQCKTFPSGNAAAVHGIVRSRAVLAKDPDAVCLVGGIDSLLAEETLAWLESDRRLKTETAGRHQGMFPAQAAGFFIVESKGSATRNGTPAVAEILGIGLADEPAPIVSTSPSSAEGLSLALIAAMSDAGVGPEIIDTVVCDLSGEMYRFKEWGLADVRCLSGSKDTRRIVHPADGMGSIGAASMPVLVNIAASAFSGDSFSHHALVFCSDDHGERGAVILKKNSLP
jgi:3-oxoacyl-[acyl-carrier-protein] synthase-1